MSIEKICVAVVMLGGIGLVSSGVALTWFWCFTLVLKTFGIYQEFYAFMFRRDTEKLNSEKKNCLCCAGRGGWSVQGIGGLEWKECPDCHGEQI